jgi:hypothetical protein
MVKMHPIQPQSPKNITAQNWKAFSLPVQVAFSLSKSNLITERPFEKHFDCLASSGTPNRTLTPCKEEM